MPARYLVGFDGSSPSEVALAWAVGRSRRDSAEIVLVQVTDGEAGAMGVEVVELERREAVQLLAGRAASLRAAEPLLAIGTLWLEGSVPWELAASARANDMIVVGTHKTGRLQGRVLGSRSVQIVIAARCSVAVIPEHDLRFRSGVVAGVDLVATAAMVAERAADEAARRGEELLIVQAAVPQGRGEEAPLAAALQVARERHPELVVRSRVSPRPAAEALLDAARDRALLVLGPGSGDRLRSPIGSVVHDVLMNVNAPVMIVRSEDEDRSAAGI